MGNKLGRRRQVVDDKYTRPQGLYQIKDVDYKKLRKLILESKLAPCYPGGDDCDCALFEECPICFLYYPTLNRSRCCMKSICTECFLQMKNPNSTRPTQCPFCKTSNYAVEYKGVKSKEERGQEQIEEQKVIEAKIRMRQQELQEEEEKQNKKEEVSCSSSEFQTGNTGCSSSAVMECEEVIASSGDASTAHRQFQSIRQNRGDEFDLDLEDIMVMEAIWLSIQENGRAGYTSACDGLPEQYETGDHYASPGTVSVAEPSPSPSPSPSSPSGGLACAIAALAERQQLNGESSTTNYNGHVSPFDMLPSSSRNSQRLKKTSQHPPENYSSSMSMSNARMFAGDCGVDHVSEVAEAGTSYISSDDSDGEEPVVLPPPPPVLQYGRRNSKRSKNIQRKYPSSKSLHDTMAEEWEFDALPPPPPPPHFPFYNAASTSGAHTENGEGGSYYHVPPPQYGGTDGGFHSSVPNPIVPESFEEQMMLAMAVSLADARTRTTAQGVAWQ
ncbi:hypothetical protein RND81_12G239200 [Saponaria officinalis]|uniref:RING-type domain-containing protein n=1 Tax=Saponaria officinalis TaxID=3572 RepID=A0AAW1HEQ3_SAPOF